jgi:hypothetical protein
VPGCSVPVSVRVPGRAFGGVKMRERVPGGNVRGLWALDGAEAVATSVRVA